MTWPASTGPAAGASRAGHPLPTRARHGPRARLAALACELHVRSLDVEPSTELVFQRLFGDAEYAFWLDSADAPTRLAQSSYLGTSTGARSACCTTTSRPARSQLHARARRRVEHGLDLRRPRPRASPTPRSSRPRASPRGLIGGYVGYLGYECKADCGSPNVHRSDIPDAVMMFANRVVAVDHVQHRTHLLALTGPDDGGAGRPLARRGRGCSARGARRATAGHDRAARRRAAADAPEDPVLFRVRARTHAVPRRHRPQPGGARRRRVLRGLPDRSDLHDGQPGSVPALPAAAPQEPLAVCRLPQARRAGDRELLARALPVGRPRPPRRGAPDQGHRPARGRPGSRPGSCAPSCSPTRRRSPST